MLPTVVARHDYKEIRVLHRSGKHDSSEYHNNATQPLNRRRSPGNADEAMTGQESIVRHGDTFSFSNISGSHVRPFDYRLKPIPALHWSGRKSKIMVSGDYSEIDYLLRFHDQPNEFVEFCSIF